MQIAADIGRRAIRIVAGGGIEQVVDGLPCEAPGHTQDDGGDGEGGDRVSDLKTADVEALSQPRCQQTQENGG